MSFSDWSICETQYYRFRKLPEDFERPVFYGDQNTLRYVIGYVPISISLGLISTSQTKIRFRGPLRAVFHWVTSSVAISMHGADL